MATAGLSVEASPSAAGPAALEPAFPSVLQAVKIDEQQLSAVTTYTSPSFRRGKYWKIGFSIRRRVGAVDQALMTLVGLAGGTSYSSEAQTTIWTTGAVVGGGVATGTTGWQLNTFGPVAEANGFVDIRPIPGGAGTGQRVGEWVTYIKEGGAGRVRFLSTGEVDNEQDDVTAIHLAFAGAFTGDVLIWGIPLFNVDVTFIGDSITDGFGSTLGDGYRRGLSVLRPGWLSAGPVDDWAHLSPINHPEAIRYHDGVDGQTTQNVIAGWTPGGAFPVIPNLTTLWGLYGSPVCFLMLGVAQALLSPISQVAFCANMQAIVDTIRGLTPNVRIFVGGPTNLPTGAAAGDKALVNQYRLFLPSAMGNRPQVHYVPMPVLPDADFSDLSHPNDAGYAVITSTFNAAVTAAGL